MNRKYWIYGLIGCALFGIGDWLLGYVDPGAVTEQLDVLKIGHGAGYDLTRITLTLFTGALGVPFMMLGCMRTAELATDKKNARSLRYAMMILPVGWLLIHFTVTCGIYAYSWNIQHGGLALEMAQDMTNRMKPAQVIGDAFAAIALIMLPIYVLRRKTVLPKSSLWFTPTLWMALLAGLKFIIPASPFSNGIDTFCMNAGMMIWFLYLLIKRA